MTKRERQRRRRARREIQKARRAKALEVRHRKLSLYYSNVATVLVTRAERRLERKTGGTCSDCPSPCLEDNIRCAACRDRNRASCLATYERRKRLDEQIDAAYQPLEAVVDLTRVRVLRAARFLDWFPFSELFDLLGGGDPTWRNTVTQSLARMCRMGRFERRRIPDGFSGHGAQWEYLITPAGIEEIDGILKGSIAPSRSGAKRRAA